MMRVSVPNFLKMPEIAPMRKQVRLYINNIFLSPQISTANIHFAFHRRELLFTPNTVAWSFPIYRPFALCHQASALETMQMASMGRLPSKGCKISFVRTHCSTQLGTFVRDEESLLFVHVPPSHSESKSLLSRIT